MPADVLMPAPHSNTIFCTRPCLICSAMPFKSSDVSTCCWTASSYSCQRATSSFLRRGLLDHRRPSAPKCVPWQQDSITPVTRELVAAGAAAGQTAGRRHCQLLPRPAACLTPARQHSATGAGICHACRILHAACIDRPPAHCLLLCPQRMSVHLRSHWQSC